VREKLAGDVAGNLFVLKEVVEAKKSARHRLVSAGKSLWRLYHPALPRVRRVLNDDANSRVYWLVEYIAGEDLEALRKQQPENLFTWPQVIHIMTPIIAAVTYLHQQRPPMLHGDIKPANILIPRGGGAVLVDFAMSKTRKPRSTTAAGRSRYRAPEQFGGRIDVSADIYALGATCYTLVTGKLPPDARARLAQVGKQTRDPLEPPNRIVPALPPHIGMAIERAMALDARARFPSVEEFWEALLPVPADYGTPVFGPASVPQGLPAVPEQGPGRTIEKPTPEPPLAGYESESAEEQVDPDAEKPLPELPPIVPPGVSVQQQQAKTVRLNSPQQIYLNRWLSYQSGKNQKPSDQAQGSSPSQPEVEVVPPLPISSRPEVAPADAAAPLAAPLQIEGAQTSPGVPAPSMPKRGRQPSIRSYLLWPAIILLSAAAAVAGIQMYAGKWPAAVTLSILIGVGLIGSALLLATKHRAARIKVDRMLGVRKRRTAKSVPPPPARSPLARSELGGTDVSATSPFARRSRSDQHGRIDQESPWPDMDIEMSFNQSDWEWSVSSKPERDGQEAED
jgi:serine/threonine protein kinase